MEGMRLRVVFEDRQILSKSQRTEGLKRSWVLLKPHHHTISDLSAHLLHVFDLDQACPDGLVLSDASVYGSIEFEGFVGLGPQKSDGFRVEGFVLPPFESTSILKEKDIIRLKKKRGPCTDIVRVRDGRKSNEEEEALEKLPVHEGMKLLANEEFENESGGYQSEAEEGELEKLVDKSHVDDIPEKNRVSKKRKASKKLKRSNDRRKRNKLSTVEDVQNDVQPEQNGSSHQHSLPEKSPVKNDMSSDTHSEPDNLSTPEIDERTDNINTSTPSKPSSCQLQENGKKSLASSHTSGGVGKLPSRSTRRKKAKRQWLREQAKIRENELPQTQSIKTVNQQSSGKDNCKFAEEHGQDKCNYEGDDIVPVVVRPGHIRFESLEKDVTADADEAIQPYKISAVNFQWNGITSKKKGQKWGKEKTAFYKRSDQKKLNPESSDVLVNVEEPSTVNVHVDFDKLKPCTAMPQIGDKVAYRLVELSASWTPELSSFRVGKVSNYDPKSDKITLVQVPDYPIVFEERDEESAVQPNVSLYGEDGSLEIDYSSLADVRIIKYGNGTSVAAKSVTNAVCPASNTAKSVTNGVLQASSSRLMSTEETKARSPIQENGKVNAWDEICEALNAKKAQLSQEDNWNKKKSSPGCSSRSSWSNRSLRGSALGPTMALLRAQNDL
ncbi:Coilin [Parasponia andersonii]|uniref:Coilin n=1 Tax=Parasponia andersonii TaxID=3476 RepID=A0A2P5CTA7_PARAD|nr:Coilin [Parasponia andersonii]